MLDELLVVGLLASAQAPAAPPPVTPDWKVVVAMPVYQPDGGVSVETAAPAGDRPSIVHMFSRRTQCDTATAGANEPGDARFGWRVLVHTVRTTASEVVVSVDWRRVWDAGRKLSSGPAATVQLTLHPGDRIPLDLIPNNAATDTCRAVGLGLEVKLTRANVVAPAGSSLLPLGAVETVDSTFRANLWLVHKLPAGTEQAEHQSVQVPVGGGSVSFAPVSLSTPQGEALVEIAATFRRFKATAGGEYLLVSMSRTVNGSALPAGGVTGGSSTVIALPGPGEVLSLEIPTPARMGGRGGGGARGGPIGEFPAGAVARGGGGVGQASAGTGEPPPGRQRSGGVGVAGGGGAGGRGGGGARSGGGAGDPSMAALVRSQLPGLAQAAIILEGHSFALRLRAAQ